MEKGQSNYVCKYQPLVSIIMPSYNSEQYLSSSIESVISQTYNNWELLIIDDCSSDRTFDIALEYQKKYSKIKCFKTQKNSGTARARNIGLDAAKGELICFLDSDDLYDEFFLKKQVSFMEKKDAYFAFCSFRRLTANGSTDYIVPKKATASRILYGSCLTPLSVIIRNKNIGDLRFHEECEVEDLVFFYELLKKHGPAIGNKEVLATYRIVPNSKSRDKKKLIKKMWTTYRKSLNKNFIFSLVFIFCWGIHGVLKYRKVKV